MRALVFAIACLAAPPALAQQRAPVDLTGYWVSVVSEDWAWRMVTPAKGDYASLPLTPEATRIANQWNPADSGGCKPYGAAAVMRHPGRLHITWEDATTLRIDTDAGAQTRRLRFNTAPAAGPRDLQGHSVARWDTPGEAQPGRWASLKVTTANMTAGWLRKNGVPYSENAVMTEYFDHFSDGVDEWFTVTTIVEDPIYLTQPLVISSNFKKEPDGAKWKPAPCR